MCPPIRQFVVHALIRWRRHMEVPYKRNVKFRIQFQCHLAGLYRNNPQHIWIHFNHRIQNITEETSHEKCMKNVEACYFDLYLSYNGWLSYLSYDSGRSSKIALPTGHEKYQKMYNIMNSTFPQLNNVQLRAFAVHNSTYSSCSINYQWFFRYITVIQKM